MVASLRRGDAGPRSRRRPALALALTVLLAALAAIPWSPARVAAAADKSVDLYGSLVGWSTTPGGETNPGPTLVVTLGDFVTVRLTSEDALDHALFIDYNANGAIDPSDFVSPTTTSQITFTFVADVAGAFTYYCKQHSPPYDPALSLMRGTWITNTAPAAALHAPGAGASWTGGVSHDITFDASDPDGDGLQATLDYTYDSGSLGGRIAGPFLPGTNPNVVAWTPSGFTAADTVVLLTVQDARGATTIATSPAFEVDSTPPSIAAASPPDGATNVGLNAVVSVTWSEPMVPSTSGAPGTFGVSVSGGPWLAGTVAWSPDAREMSFTPSADLIPATGYEVHVNTSAVDDSTPGNALPAPALWRFTTGSAPDLTPPSVFAVGASPVTQVAGGSVSITADVTDDVAVGAVSAAVTGPSFQANVTMSPAGGERWFADRPYTAVGGYSFTVWARDASGNAASLGGTFQITAAPPGPTPGLPAPLGVSGRPREDGSVEVTWSPVSAPDLVGYHVYRGTAAGGPLGRVTTSPTPASVTPAYVDRNVTAGRTYYYAVTAVNATGGESPRSAIASVRAAAPSGAFDPLPWAAGGLSLGVALGAIYLVMRRRKGS